MATLESRVSRFEDKSDNLMARDIFRKLRDDFKPILAAHATRETIREAPFIADDMGCKLEGILKVQDLMALSEGKDLSGLSRDDLRSFHRADLVMRVSDQRGVESYIAVEISYTVSERDTTRAIRNAEYLERFTGRPARAAVVGLRRDRKIEDIEPDEVFWYELPESILEVE
ncbi:MAG: hypothetical protein F4Z35_06125 [Dehalococcoidia bacterium]|nr:hypothetical protein [Dehalococcoidia bacterium]